MDFFEDDRIKRAFQKWLFEAGELGAPGELHQGQLLPPRLETTESNLREDMRWLQRVNAYKYNRIPREKRAHLPRHVRPSVIGIPSHT
ncbi:hypothetical protein [Pelagicoccus sp. SDUM812002]|uniref:hypothetical protein n=1 Tax=Pelagicoccus sp. SDUM812002 TaxID=3041266 RepID=UPI0028106047|nr:hypothetical protein [Pelagicoccus sp. SDUM812002]MDQ8188357.1 hypothetical protein [Pelagicoccus sp. SDUM812002]